MKQARKKCLYALFIGALSLPFCSYANESPTKQLESINPSVVKADTVNTIEQKKEKNNIFAEKNVKVLNYQVPCLTVLGDETNGKISYLPLKFTKEENGKPLRIAITDDTPGGSGRTIHSSVWMAAVTAAMLRNDTMHGVTISIEFSGNVDGPSAGGVVCLTILSALDGLPLPKDFAMTGTILPDGTIGSVGGVPEKIRAAASAGVKRIFIPAFTRVFKNKDGKDGDVTRIAEELKVELHQVENISEVYAILQNKPYHQDGYVNVRNMTKLPRNVEDVLLPVYKDLIEKVSEKVKKNPKDVQGGIPLDYYFSPEIAREYYEEGKFLPATLQIFHTWQAWNAREKTTDFIDEFFKKHNCGLGGIEYLREYHLRKIISTLQKEMQDKIEKLVDEMEKNNNECIKSKHKYVPENAHGYYPFAQDYTEISAQIEQSDVISVLLANIKKLGKEQPEQNELDVANEQKLSEYYDSIRDMIETCFLLTSNWDSLDNFLIKLGGTFPKLHQNQRAPEVEQLFFSAMCAANSVANLNISDHYLSMFNDIINNGKGETASKRLDNSAFTINCAETTHNLAFKEHVLLLPDATEKPYDIPYQTQASLKLQISAFAWSSAAMIAFGSDRSNDFIRHLMRNARKSAINNINECVKAGIPCLAPILDFECAEASRNNNADSYSTLVSYWKAALYSKALLMSFQQL